MARLFTLIYILALLLAPLPAASADKTQYSWLADRAEGMSSDKIMQLADRYAADGKQGEALVLYAMVYGRWRDGMDDAAKNICVLACKQAGAVYYGRDDYVNALDRFIYGVKLSGQCAEQRYAANLYNNIGNVYGMFLDYEKSIDYYLKAYDYVKKHPDRKVEYIILSNLTGTYTFIDDVANAKKYFRLTERLMDKADPVNVFMRDYMFSLIQVKEGDAAPAIARLKDLARYAVDKKIGPSYVCFAYQEIYNAYALIGRRDSALKYMMMCDEEAGRHNLQHTFAETLKNISEFYEEKGDVAKSNLYKSRYLDIMDSVYDTREFDAVKNSLFSYEVGQTAKEIDDLKKSEEDRLRTIRQQRMVMGGVALLLVVTAVFLAVVWRQKRRLDRSYADLYSVNRDFIDTQGRLTERLRGASEALTAKDGEIAALKAELGKAKEPAPEQPETTAVKYQSSSLTDDQARALADAIQDVMENTTAFCDCNFSLSALADLVGSNSKYVSQVINDTFHKSFNDYVNPYRIHLACSRFADTAAYGNLTMKAVAEGVGFKSYTSFVNIFRKVTGIAPSLYRKMALQGAQES